MNTFQQPSGTLTLIDVVRFSYFHLMGRQWPFMLAFLVMTLYGVVAAGTTWDLANPRLAQVSFGCMPLLMFALPYWGARRQHKNLPYLRESLRYEFQSDLIRLKGPRFSGEIAWSLVQGIYETKTTFLIYQTPQIAWVLPKRFFWGDDRLILEWKQFVIAHLANPRNFHEPGFIGRWI